VPAVTGRYLMPNTDVQASTVDYRHGLANAALYSAIAGCLSPARPGRTGTYLCYD
jgi:hypothetical protein